MVSAKRLVDMARKWQKMAAGKRKRITYPRRRNMDMHYSAAIKGHFVVYSVDRKRFMVPLKYLSNNVFKELLKWSEEEFGLCSDGPIMLPCDSVLLEYVISLCRNSSDLGNPSSKASCKGEEPSLLNTPSIILFYLMWGYCISNTLMNESVAEEIQKALITSLATGHGVASSSTLALTQSHQQQAIICGY